MGVFKVILGFIMMRPRAALMIGGALLAAWGLKKVMTKDEEEEQEEEQKEEKDNKNNEQKTEPQSYDEWRANYDASNTRIQTKEGVELAIDLAKEADSGA